MNVVLSCLLHGLPCTRQWVASMSSFFLHIGFLHLWILVLILLPVFKLLMVLGNISRLGNWNVEPLSTTHFQLKCHLSVVFSDSTLSNSCPLSCFQAWKSRCCLSLDSFLWLGTEVFMGRSAVFSQAAEPNIRFSALNSKGRSHNDFCPCRPPTATDKRAGPSEPTPTPPLTAGTSPSYLLEGC